MVKDHSPHGMSRRNFMKTTAVGLGAAALMGAGLKEAKAAPPPKKWDRETDVLIVGYGGAGACAAIEAHDAGARVLIVEKAPITFPGGSTGCSMAFMLPPSNAGDGRKYFAALGSGTVTDPELIDTYVQTVMGAPGWLEKMGIPVRSMSKNRPGYFPDLPGSKIDYFQVPGGGHVAFKGLSKQVQDRKIEVLYETRALRLVQNYQTGEVLGLIAQSQEKNLAIKARKSVILASGGYISNREMTANFNYPGLTFYPFGTPYSTGDGVMMSQGAGAKLWHMSCLQFSNFNVKAASEQLHCAVPIGITTEARSFIFVNKAGRRFMDENRRLSHHKGQIEALIYDHDKARYANLPMFMIFDESFRKTTPLIPKNYLPNAVGGWAFVHKLVDGWSTDNSREIEKGWIAKADTLAELAEKIGVDAAGLDETVKAYNDAQAAGKDPHGFRNAKTMVPLAAPPFYATELGLTLINTQGGPKHNAKAQVLDLEEKPIPRLFAAGELGSFFGHLYQGGNNFPEAIAFGRIAGQQAAKLKSWK